MGFNLPPTGGTSCPGTIATGGLLMPRVLVVEDERKVRRSLEEGLRAAGFEVVAAATGDEGTRLCRGGTFEVVVLDWMLPGMDGLDVLRTLRADGRAVPVLMLTARDAIDDRVAGLD